MKEVDEKVQKRIEELRRELHREVAEIAPVKKIEVSPTKYLSMKVFKVNLDDGGFRKLLILGGSLTLSGDGHELMKEFNVGRIVELANEYSRTPAGLYQM